MFDGRSVDEYRYLVYADFNHGRGFELAAWYDDYKDAKKVAVFLRGKGYEVEIRDN